MRSLLDGKFSNLIKAQQAFKFDKDYDTQLSISIDSADKAPIDSKELQNRLKVIKEFKFDKVDIDWLESTSIFDDSFLKDLKKYKVPNLKLTTKKDSQTISVEGKYSDLILLEVGLQSLLCESRFAAFVSTLNQDVGYFYSFATDRFNMKTANFLSSSSISIVEDSSAFRPDSDFYSLQCILLPVNNFNYVGTTNPLIALTFNQAVVAFCDEERWFEDWPDSNFAPSVSSYDTEKHKGFYLAEPDFATFNDLRNKYPNAIIISKELSVFEMAHINSHFGNVVWLWSQSMIQDMNIQQFSAKVVWAQCRKIE